MEFRSVKAAVSFIKNLRTTRGYSSTSTSEWRRLSMKLSDSALIQFARRLAVRLEVENNFLVGVDEQEFSPKIYTMNQTSYCVLSLKKSVDESTRVTYTLGHISDEISLHEIDVKKTPTDDDMIYALSIIEGRSFKIKSKKARDEKTSNNQKCSSR
jgi:hypothetical protein